MASGFNRLDRLDRLESATRLAQIETTQTRPNTWPNPWLFLIRSVGQMKCVSLSLSLSFSSFLPLPLSLFVGPARRRQGEDIESLAFATATRPCDNFDSHSHSASVFRLPSSDPFALLLSGSPSLGRLTPHTPHPQPARPDDRAT
ncbi:unnamed protein product [Protopolystoma xenopodis]|uniref:Uncharacterized protein n=1 Tax=Protopolystoma xenopodis TaxID=117903 RepID=A0A3S5BCI9_9PLAT|nr:unnamed protein product [Protopolystoma xenopodis]